MSVQGIYVRHRKGCSSPRADGKCCGAAFQARVFDKRDGKLWARTFDNRTTAKIWRQDVIAGVRNGTVGRQSRRTVREAAEQWLAAARADVAHTRSGQPYKPATVRAYEQALQLRVLPELGDRRLSDVRRGDLQRLVTALASRGLSPSTVQCTLLPLRAIFREALAADEVAVNPTSGLRMPAVRSSRDRIASPAEADALVRALPVGDRALWATALYAGLRRGELLALRREDVDLAAGTIRVERSWDLISGPVAPKSAEGRRTVPMPPVLRDYLDGHLGRTRRETGLIFGPDGEGPASPGSLTRRAREAWDAAGLTRLTLHDCRHTYAAFMIAAGVNAKALCTYMGHHSITVTMDRYGHLMPGNEDQAATLLNSYLEDALATARAAVAA